jgi:hypothetical protein
MLGKSVSVITVQDVKFFNEGAGGINLMNARCYLLDEEDFKEFERQAETEKGRDHKALAYRRKYLKNFMQALGVSEGGEVLTAEAMKAAAEYAVRNKDVLSGLGIIRKAAKCKTDREIQAVVTAVLKSMGLSKKQVTHDGVKEYRLTKTVFLHVLSFVDKDRHDMLTGSKNKLASMQKFESFLISTDSLGEYKKYMEKAQ